MHQHPQLFDTHAFNNGVIFKASDKTYGECLQRQLFGLPSNQMERAVRSIAVGETALFLYNFQSLQLQGVYVATEGARMNIEPDAWKQTGPRSRDGSSPFPAQVLGRSLRPSLGCIYACLPASRACARPSVAFSCVRQGLIECGGGRRCGCARSSRYDR